MTNAALVKTVTRLIGTIAAVGILVLQYVAYQAARGINGHYFHDDSAHLGALDIGLLALVAYLILLSATGRWRIIR